MFIVLLSDWIKVKGLQRYLFFCALYQVYSSPWPNIRLPILTCCNVNTVPNLKVRLNEETASKVLVWFVLTKDLLTFASYNTFTFVGSGSKHNTLSPTSYFAEFTPRVKIIPDIFDENLQLLLVCTRLLDFINFHCLLLPPSLYSTKRVALLHFLQWTNKIYCSTKYGNPAEMCKGPVSHLDCRQKKKKNNK